MPRVLYRPIDNEPEGGWLSPSGPGQWPDLQELDAKQRAPIKDHRHAQ